MSQSVEVHLDRLLGSIADSGDAERRIAGLHIVSLGNFFERGRMNLLRKHP